MEVTDVVEKDTTVADKDPNNDEPVNYGENFVQYLTVNGRLRSRNCLLFHYV